MRACLKVFVKLTLVAASGGLAEAQNEFFTVPP